MYRVFGHLNLMSEPLPLIRRLAEIEGEREAGRLLTELRHRALADGLEMGREFVPDPKDPPPKSKAHYKLTGFIDEVKRLQRQMEPWRDWDGIERAQRLKENDEKWRQLYAAMGVKQ